MPAGFCGASRRPLGSITLWCLRQQQALPSKMKARGVVAMAMDVMVGEVKGAQMQFARIAFDSGDATVGKDGGLSFTDGVIAIGTVFGDGSAQARGLVGGGLLCPVPSDDDA